MFLKQVSRHLFKTNKEINRAAALWGAVCVIARQQRGCRHVMADLYGFDIHLCAIKTETLAL